MVDDDQVVETSDVDEREALETDQFKYWQRAAHDIRVRRLARSSPSPSPAKRVKLVHESSHVHFYSPFSSPSALPSICPSSPSDDLTLDVRGSSKSSSPVPTPQDHDNNDVQHKSTWDDVALDNSQDPLDMFAVDDLTQSKVLHSCGLDISATNDVDMGSADIEAVSVAVPQQSRSQSRSRSIDPLHLFSSLPHKTKHIAHKDSPDVTPSMPTQIASSEVVPSQLSPQNLSPTPPPLAQNLVPSPRSPSTHNSSSVSLPASPSPNNPHPRSVHDEQAAAGLAESESRRYSMRARKPQQLKPYVYDKMLYKQQMKSNPDAIVKFARHRSRSRSRGMQGNDEGSGREMENGEGETQEWVMSEEEEEEDTWIDRRRNQRQAQKNPDRRSGSGAEDGGPSVEPTWLPQALQDLLTSSDEDEEEAAEVQGFLKEARRLKAMARRQEKERAKEREEEEREEKNRERRRRRLKPFPLRREREKGKQKENKEEITMAENDSGREEERSPSIFLPVDDEIAVHRGVISRSRSRTPPQLKSPPISIRSTSHRASPFQSKSPTAAVEDDPADYDFGRYNDAWVGDDGGVIDMDYMAESPTQQPRPSTSSSNLRRRESSVIDVDASENDNGKRVKPKPSSRIDSETEVSSATESSSSEEMTAKDRKRLKALQRMMPAAMARRLEKNAQEAKATAAAKKQRRSTTAEINASGSDIEAGPLLPGQTRVRIGERRRDADIRGDTESSDEEPQHHALEDDGGSSPATHLISDSDVEVIQKPSRKKDYIGPTEITYLSDSVDDEDTGDDELDDDRIDAWLGGNSRSAGTGNPHREESLVDWMLTRTRTVGGTSKKIERKKKLKSRTVRRAYEGHGRVRVVTAGARQGIQTLLSFDNHTKSKHPKNVEDAHHRRSSILKRTPFNDGAEMCNYDDDPEPVAPRVLAKGAMTSAAIKRKKKAKARAAAQQLYIFTSKGTRITSGRRRTESAITIDVDEGFHQALAPFRDDGMAGTHRLPTRRGAKPKTIGVHDLNHAALHASMDVDITYQPPATHIDLPTSSHRRDIKIDFDIPFLPSGIAFGTHTYIGKGLLRELVTLISGSDNVAVPNTYTAHGIELSPAMSPSDISNAIVSICGGLLNFIFGPADDYTAGSEHYWESIMRTLCQILFWFPINATAEDCTIVENTLQEQLLQLVLQIEDREDAFGPDGEPSNALILTIYWFSIESSVRFHCSIQKKHPAFVCDTKNLIKYMSLLARRLQDYGIQRTLAPILCSPGELDTHHIPQRTAELWVCLLHLVNSYNIVSTDRSVLAHHPFWRIIQFTLQHDDGSRPSGLEASENTWRIIFSLCALSQFSMHGMTTSTCRLTTSWELVVFALTQIQLLADSDNEKMLSERSLTKRDDYIWVIASRCFILCNRWHWRLENGSAVFKQLVGIFGSRKFANLRREPSDFPAFMLKNDLQLLCQYKPSDTAFELLLKLIVQVTNDDHANDGAGAQKLISSTLKKFLAVAIPVGSVPFTKSTPPTLHELSMLYNRFSVIAVAIYLENSPADTRRRLAHARRYVDFKNADDTTRIACMRGMMYLAIIMRYRRLPLDEVLSWLAEMTNVLVDEYQDIDTVSKTNSFQLSNVTKHRTILSVQVLLGSVRRIIESSNIDPKLLQKQYPEPALLDGPWVKRIFANSTNLANITTTGLEIRKLVQAFLDARQAIMGRPQRLPAIPSVTNGESQESQDEYGAFDLDLDDPELQVALGDDGQFCFAKENKANDELICKVINEHISPAIYRLVCKHFNDPLSASFEYCQDADMWIDCWVGCVTILVQNGKKTWDSFLNLAPQSWERIIDASWRRRVGLRFMFMVLRLDPEAYTQHVDQFIKVLLESIMSAKVTIENEYMGLVFSIDKLRHPLLRHVPCQPEPGTSDYHISTIDFLTLRLPAVNTIFANMADSLRKENGKFDAKHHQIYIGFIIAMLSTMQTICEQIVEGSVERTTYLTFCHEVLARLRQHPELTSQPRLGSFLTWGQTLTGT